MRSSSKSAPTLYFRSKSNHYPMRTCILWCALLLLCSCNKTVDALLQKVISDPAANKTTTASQFVRYTIAAGQHYAAQNNFQTIDTDTLKFVVRFDSSAIYKSVTPENQYDINKLYGFSDNNAQHHEYSARFGWAWNNGALHLYAYVYNEGKIVSKELGPVAIGTDVACSIVVKGSTYVFTWDDQQVMVPRLSTTPKAKGYLLYPYFGGDEVAPHLVTIWIKAL